MKNSTVIARNGAKRNDMTISSVMRIHPDEMVTSSSRTPHHDGAKTQKRTSIHCMTFWILPVIKSIAYPQVMEKNWSKREGVGVK